MFGRTKIGSQTQHPLAHPASSSGSVTRVVDRGAEWRTLERLPAETLTTVLQFLDADEVARLTRVSERVMFARIQEN